MVAKECMITVAPKPLSLERISVPMPEGLSLRGMLENVPGGSPHLRVFIDGEFIPEDRWEWLYPGAHQIISARRQVKDGGGGGSGKNIGALVLGVVLVAAAIALGPVGIGVLGTSATNLGLLGAGIALSGVVGLVSAKPRQQGSGALSGPDRFSIQATSNVFEPYGSIPKMFGTIRTSPKMAAVPFTEIANGDQLLRQVFVVGYGPLTISDIKIADTPVANFTGFEVETRPGEPGDAPLTLYSRTVKEEGLSILLDQASGFIQQTTIAGITTISVDLTAQSGLGKFQDDGDFKGVTVVFDIEYSLVGAGTWIAIPTGTLYKAGIDKFTLGNPTLVRANEHEFYDGDVVTFDTVPGTTGVNGQTGVATRINDDNFSVAFDSSSSTPWNGQAGFISIVRGEIFGGKSTSVVRHNKTWDVAENQYDVRIRRISPDTADPNRSDKVTWTALRTFSDVQPVAQKEMALIAIRVQATDQLNGIINELNCMVSAKYQVYDGATWSLQASNSPAWAYVDVLTGKGNDEAIALDRIDADAMKTWADNCATAGREFNYTLHNDLTIRDLLAMIATAGRATQARNPFNGKYTIVEDKHQTIVRQHWTPRNSWGYEMQRFYVEFPHGIKAEFLDETNNYQQETQIVYRDGFNEGNATRFETLVWEGLTNPDHVWQETAFHLASLMARPEVHAVNVDIENLACQRGDWVRLAAPAALIGVSSGRILSLGVSGTDVTTITLDAICTMVAGKLYEVEMRQDITTPIDRAVNFVVGDNTLLTFTIPIPDTEDQPKVGDLVSFGEENLVTADMIVKTISHFDGTHARLELIDRADGIHAIDQETPPVWISHITLPANPLGQILPVPIIQHIDSSEIFLVRGPEGSLQARMSVQLRIPSGAHGVISYYQVQHRLQDTELGPGDWMTAPLAVAVLGEVLLSGVLEGQIYDVRARSTNGLGLTSVWSPIVFHTVIGKSSPPPDVATFLTSRDSDGTRRLTWTIGTKPLDFAGVKRVLSPTTKLTARSIGVVMSWRISTS